MDHETSVVTLAALGVPIVGEVTEIDTAASRLTLLTERGALEVEINAAESLTGIDIGDVITISFPLGTTDS
jgi:hypothetical protein